MECFKQDKVEKISQHWADIEYVHDITKFSVFHWLAFHNDHESIKYIIKHIDEDQSINK